MKGRLIVIEGGDGSGKATQTKLLQKHLQDNKLPYKTLSFPQYKNTFFGKTIARILKGEIAPLKNMNPYLFSMVYAMDRAEAKDKMYQWLNNGRIVVLDRYVSSNMAHQTGRLPKKEQSKFLKWLDELEYKINNVPREDIVIFLHVPYKTTLFLMQNKNRKKGSHTKGSQSDLAEQDTEYLKKAEEVYLSLYKKFSHWEIVECTNTDNTMRTREEIHEEIVDVLRKKHIL